MNSYTLFLLFLLLYKFQLVCVCVCLSHVYVYISLSPITYFTLSTSLSLSLSLICVFVSRFLFLSLHPNSLRLSAPSHLPPSFSLLIFYNLAFKKKKKFPKLNKNRRMVALSNNYDDMNIYYNYTKNLQSQTFVKWTVYLPHNEPFLVFFFLCNEFCMELSKKEFIAKYIQKLSLAFSHCLCGCWCKGINFWPHQKLLE